MLGARVGAFVGAVEDQLRAGTDVDAVDGGCGVNSPEAKPCVDSLEDLGFVTQGFLRTVT